MGEENAGDVVREPVESSVSVQLEPVSPAEYRTFVDAQILEYADQKVRAGHWRREEAEGFSRHAVESFLPRKGPTRGHRVWKVVDRRGLRVGWVWIGPPPVRPLDVPSKRWLYQITVEPAKRGRGFGRAALAAAEAILAADGVTELYLNVFRWNEIARSLYESAGFEVVHAGETETGMRKLLRDEARG